MLSSAVYEKSICNYQITSACDRYVIRQALERVIGADSGDGVVGCSLDMVIPLVHKENGFEVAVTMT
jgi:hypothetical protein